MLDAGKVVDRRLCLSGAGCASNRYAYMYICVCAYVRCTIQKAPGDRRSIPRFAKVPTDGKQVVLQFSV